MVELQLTKSFRIRTDQPDITSNFTGTIKLTKDFTDLKSAHPSDLLIQMSTEFQFSSAFIAITVVTKNDFLLESATILINK